MYQGKYNLAASHFAECIEVSRLISKKGRIVACLIGFGGLCMAQGRAIPAARLLGSAEALLESNLHLLERIARKTFDSTAAALRAQLDEATFNAAWEEGRQMTLEQAVEYALEEVK